MKLNKVILEASRLAYEEDADMVVGRIQGEWCVAHWEDEGRQASMDREPRYIVHSWGLDEHTPIEQDEPSDNYRPPAGQEWKETHQIIFPGGATELVMLTEDRIAYTREEWHHEDLADWEVDEHGNWLFQGQPRQCRIKLIR